MKPIEIGDQAPDVKLVSQDRREIRLSDYRGKQAVVLFFYPKDNTRVCTKEACSFRDRYEDFVAAGAAVIGISGDTHESHRNFAQSNRLPYLLVSDTSGTLRKTFGVPKTFGLIPGRVTYVIDREGIVRHMFRSQLQGEKHVEEALRTIQELAEAEQK